ncbi:MAG: hypothetical protein EAZ66_07290, partial [Alphaproteobacteria bacterium]
TAVEGNHNGTITYSVTSADANYNGLTLAPLTVAITDNDTSTVPGSIFINTGGGAYTDSMGQLWSADQLFTGGETSSTTSAIANTTNDPLFQNERYGNFSYTIPVTNGSYEVNLGFAEIYWNSANNRLFNVTGEGQALLTNYDIWTDAGGRNTSVIKKFNVDVADGFLNLNFTTIVDNAKVDFIQVTPTIPESRVSLRDSETIFVSETAGSASVTLVRTGSTQEQMTVEYTTNEIVGAGAATAGSDYTQPNAVRANTGQVVFEIGEAEKTFTIPIVNDTLQEGNETFSIGLQNPSSGTLGAPRTVLIRILDDDNPTTSISVSEAAVTISEASPTVKITVQRTGNINGISSINYATSNNTATDGSDYSAMSGTIVFASGQATQTISIPIVNDIITEPNETFRVTLSNAMGAILGSQTTSIVTILDN